MSLVILVGYGSNIITIWDCLTSSVYKSYPLGNIFDDKRYIPKLNCIVTVQTHSDSAATISTVNPISGAIIKTRRYNNLNTYLTYGNLNVTISDTEVKVISELPDYRAESDRHYGRAFEDSDDDDFSYNPVGGRSEMVVHVKIEDFSDLKTPALETSLFSLMRGISDAEAEDLRSDANAVTAFASKLVCDAGSLCTSDPHRYSYPGSSWRIPRTTKFIGGVVNKRNSDTRNGFYFLGVIIVGLDKEIITMNAIEPSPGVLFSLACITTSRPAQTFQAIQTEAVQSRVLVYDVVWVKLRRYYKAFLRVEYPVPPSMNFYQLCSSKFIDGVYWQWNYADSLSTVTYWSPGNGPPVTISYNVAQSYSCLGVITDHKDPVRTKLVANQIKLHNKLLPGVLAEIIASYVA